MSLRGNIHSARSNPEQISQLIRVGWVKPNNNTMDCRVASAPRNDAKLAVLPTSQNIYPRNDAQPVVLPTSPNIYPRNDAQPVVLPTSPNIYPRNDTQPVVLPANLTLHIKKTSRGREARKIS